MIESILFATADGDKADWIIGVIKSVPSAESEIIRCKDCEHDGYCCRLSSRTPNDYCSHAKRRTDEVDYRKE